MFKTKKQKIMSLIVCGIYMFLLIWLILFKFNFNFNLTELDRIRNINLIPFKESIVVNGRLGIKEIVYNILVFVPLGVYVSIIFYKCSFGKKILPALCMSILFETIQFVFAIGASDITDVIGNTLGGIMGIVCYMLFNKIFKNKSITVINVLGLIIEILALAMLAILFVANI